MGCRRDMGSEHSVHAAVAAARAWTSDPLSMAAQQTLKSTCWGLVSPYLPAVPDGFNDHLAALPMRSVNALVDGRFFGLYDVTGITVFNVNYLPMVLATSAFAQKAIAIVGTRLFDFDKVTVVVVGHELVHFWQNFYYGPLRSKIHIKSQLGESAETFQARKNSAMWCIQEAHATWVMNKVASAHHFNVENRLGLAFLRAQDLLTTTGQGFRCYYALVASEKLLQWWAASPRNRAKDADKRIELVVDAFGRPQGLEVVTVPTRQRPIVRENPMHHALAMAARHEAASGTPYTFPNTPRGRRHAKTFHAHRERLLAKAVHDR